MPNRILKESICESEGLSGCTIFARDLYARLITYADDYGRFNADTQIMLARLYPREMDCIDQFDIVEALTELVGVGKIAFYTSSPRKTVYGCFPNWKDHQRVRDSKKRFPDPDDTTVNDWYLQRFIPIDLKVEIIERDGFKCQVCGKFITSDKDARRLAKHGCGMYHIDHIVPVNQGGRATLENLRLTCPTCNLKRKRKYTFKEIVDFAASRGEPLQVAASCCRNPIQSESESESESNTKERAREAGEGKAGAPAKPTRHKYGFYKNVLLSDEELEKLKAEFPTDWADRIERLSDYIESKGAKYKNHLATIRMWARKDGEQNAKHSGNSGQYGNGSKPVLGEFL